VAPYRTHQPLSAWQVTGAAVLLLLITAIVLRERRNVSCRRLVLVLGSLVPMIGLVQVGDQAMADRYAYIHSSDCF